MIVLGLTGSIGMGKSQVASMFKKLGIPVHDSDKAVHQALLPRGDAFEEVAVTFPEAWDKKSRAIDRKKLGQIVFSDPQKLKTLELILHPIAQASQLHFERAMKRQGHKMVVFEIPLLFETGAQARVDYTVCVSAPAAIQRRRVLSRKNMTPEKFEQILCHQWPDAKKRAHSDFIVQTGMGYAHSFSNVKKIIKTVKVL